MNLTASLILAAITLALGTFLGAYYTIFLKRPKLVLNGSGNGSTQTFHTHSVTISNQQGLIGIAIRQTILFGRRIHGHIVIGQGFSREPAQDCRAQLLDKDTGEFISLWWQRRDTNLPSQSVTINSGEGATLFIFAAPNDGSGDYFVYEPDSSSESQPKLLPKESHFTKSKIFTIIIYYSLNRKWSGDVMMTPGYKGKLLFKIM